MAAIGTLGKGTKIGHGTVQAGPFTDIAKIVAIKPPASKIGKSETTVFQDTSEQFIPGWLSAGECEFTLLYVTAQTVTVAGLLGQDLWFQITLPDTHTYTFEGFISDYEPGVPMKDKITEQVKITVYGPVTYA